MIKILAGFVGALVLGVVYWLYGKRSEAAGEAVGGLEEDRKRAKEAAKSGDDDKVLSEFRRQAGKK